MSLNLLDHSRPVIAVLPLPDFTLNRHLPVAWCEECALANAWVVAEAGFPWIKLHEQTRTSGPIAPDTLALMAALRLLIWAELPQLGLGIIIEAHDPVAALSVAHAAGVEFVRLNVLVGGAMADQGPRNGLAAEANAADAMATVGMLMRRDAGPEDLLRWNVDLSSRFMDAVRVPA